MAVYKWTLEQDYRMVVPFYFEVDKTYYDENGNPWLTVTGNSCLIHKGYSWDGCSPKFKVFGKIVGVWDGLKMFHRNVLDVDQQLKYASLVHYVFCQFADDLPDDITQAMVDELFYDDCLAVDFKLAWVYYKAVRIYQENKWEW